MYTTNYAANFFKSCFLYEFIAILKCFECLENVRVKQKTMKKNNVHFRLKKGGIMVDEDSCKERIQVSGDLEQMLLPWIIGKNLVKLETIYIRGYLLQLFL